MAAATDTMQAMSTGESPAARNVILMIADGAGSTTWDAASYYRHGGLGHEVYDGFDVHRYMSTYPLNTSTEPTGTGEGTASYDPAQAWSAVADNGVYEGNLGDYPDNFAGYDYLR